MFSVCLFGPDGSGKTTLSRLFRSYLHSLGVYAYISWFRGSHFFASLLARFLSRFSVFKGGDNPYYGVRIPLRLRSLWVLIEFVSILPYYFFRRLLSAFNPVIGDRGLLDFIVWIIVTLDYERFPNSILGRFLARLSLKDRNIYVKAHPTVLRKRVVNMPFDFLEKEIRCYDIIAKYYAICTMDTTNKRPRESLEELIQCVKELLGEQNSQVAS